MVKFDEKGQGFWDFILENCSPELIKSVGEFLFDNSIQYSVASVKEFFYGNDTIQRRNIILKSDYMSVLLIERINTNFPAEVDAFILGNSDIKELYEVIKND